MILLEAGKFLQSSSLATAKWHNACSHCSWPRGQVHCGRAAIDTLSNDLPSEQMFQGPVNALHRLLDTAADVWVNC